MKYGEKNPDNGGEDKGDMKGAGKGAYADKEEKMAKQANGEDEEENGDMEGEDEEEDTEKGCGSMKKSELSTEDLEKSLAKLEAMAGGDDAPSRREALIEKARASELSKSERDELFDLLGGEPPNVSDEGPGESIVKSMGENEQLAKALDVSDYLQEQHTELVKSLKVVGEEIRKSDNRNHDFNLVMAKAVTDIGMLVKSLAESVEALAGQPARAPKSAGVRTKPEQVMQKSFATQQPAEEGLAKSEILDGLNGLMEDSMAKGRCGTTEFGEDITLAVAKYEQTHQISRPMLNAVVDYRKQRSSAAH